MTSPRTEVSRSADLFSTKSSSIKSIINGHRKVSLYLKTYSPTCIVRREIAKSLGNELTDLVLIIS